MGIRLKIKSVKTIERIVLKELSNAEDGLLASTFWVRFRIDPSQLFDGLNNLLKHKIINLDGARIELTKEGRKWLEKVGPKAFTKNIEGGYMECPEEFIQPQLAINEPIIPILRLVDKSILPLSIRNKFLQKD